MKVRDGDRDRRDDDYETDDDRSERDDAPAPDLLRRRPRSPGRCQLVFAFHWR
jgi:hypothetical protein